MALETIVEPLVEEYESKGENSKLYSLVSFATSALTDGTFNGKLNEFLLNLGNLFGKGHIPYRFMLEYLTWRFPLIKGRDDYNGKASARAMINELEALWYMSGMLPLQVNMESGERVLLQTQSDYRHLRPISIGVTEPTRRNDIRAFRLYRRVTEQHRSHNGPNWTTLLNLVLTFPPLHKKMRPTGSFSDVVTSNEEAAFDDYVIGKLVQYLAGEKPIAVSSDGDVRTIEPLSGLELLTTVKMRQGQDRELSDLFKDVRYRKLSRGGKTWNDYLDLAGKVDKVVNYHGMAVNPRIVSGQWAEEDDYSLLKAVAVGKIPVFYNGVEVTVSAKENLYVFMGFKSRKPGKSPELLIPAFRRSAWRHKKDKGRNPALLLAAVLADPEVAGKIGNMSLADVEAQWYINCFKGEVRAMLTGQRILSYQGREMRILPGKNFHILRSESRYAGHFVKSLYKRINWHFSETDMTYYDFINEVGAEAEVVEYHRGSAVNREAIRKAINPTARRIRAA